MQETTEINDSDRASPADPSPSPYTVQTLPINPDLQKLIAVSPENLLGNSTTPEFLALAERIDEARRGDALEHAQSRTSFQIEKFIGIQNGYSPAHAFHILLVQRTSMSAELIRCITDLTAYDREYKARWEGVPENVGTFESGRPHFWGWRKEDEAPYWRDTDAVNYRQRLHAAQVEIRDRSLQIDFLDKLLAELEERNGGPFTAEQKQKEEPAYWAARLSAQAISDRIGRDMGIGSGNTHAFLAAVAPSIIQSGNVTPHVTFNDLFSPNVLLSKMADLTVNGLLNPCNPMVTEKVLGDMANQVSKALQGMDPGNAPETPPLPGAGVA